ncbi:hypothetical protein [Shinella sp.]|uniref:hypothetical protein n=1 Tax=Shinella sp. TaxID=1870904 RepID=UPI003F6E9E50
MPAVTPTIHARATSQKADKLAHPTARAFNVLDWAQALSEIAEPTERDVSLTFSAIWFGRQISQLRRHTDQILAPLARDEAVMLAIAQTNKDYTLLQRKITRKRREEQKLELVDIQYASQRMVNVGFADNQLPIDDVNDAMVDTIPVWLHQAMQLPSGTNSKDRDLTELSMIAARAFSLELSLSKLWQHSLWLDWRLGTIGNQLHFKPHDKKSETLRHAWLWRQQSIAAQNGFTDAAFEQLEKRAGHKPPRAEELTVTGRENKTGRKPNFIIGRATVRSASNIHRDVWKSAVENSYVGMFVDTKLPKAGFSCVELHRAWCVIADVCHLLAKKSADKVTINTSTIREWALTCDREHLTTAIVQCCRHTRQEAEDILAFLTYDGSDFRRGLWSMPLVILSDQKTILMCRSPIEIGNPIRRVEQWLERGGLSDQLSGAKRGNSYEAWVRDEIAASLEGNKLIKDFACARQPIKPSDRSIGDIDAVFRIKNLIVVAEVKCFLTPAEAIEQYRYRNKIQAAADQAIRKANWLSKNIICFKEELMIDDHRDFSVIPMVLTNQGYGLSLKFNECCICDFHYVTNYLGDSVLVVGSAIDGKTGKFGYIQETLYNSEDEARKKFIEHIENPSTLKRYVDRVEWYDSFIPCHNPPTNRLAVSGARLSSGVDTNAERLSKILLSERPA